MLDQRSIAQLKIVEGVNLQTLTSTFRSDFPPDNGWIYEKLTPTDRSYILVNPEKESVIDIFLSCETKDILRDISDSISAYVMFKDGAEFCNFIFSTPNCLAMRVLLEEYNVVNTTVDNGDLIVTISCSSNNRAFISDNEYMSLISDSKEIARKLRIAYYKSANNIAISKWEIPQFGHISEGLPTDSLGAFPEFILPTFPCKKAMEGCCVPCFFSKVSNPTGLKSDAYHSLIVQTQYIVDYFEDVVLGNQTRVHPILKDKWHATFCYACNGSLFSNQETSKETRLEAFQLLYREVIKRKLHILLYIETCAEDYYNLIISDEIQELLPILKELNTVVLCGFESAQEFTRNGVYIKDLDRGIFEYIVDYNKKAGLQTGAFLYAGFHSYTQAEIIIDIAKSLCYLIAMDVMPILMLPNIHEFTLTHLLQKYNLYSLLEPLTALELVKLITWFTKETDLEISKKDPWLMGDLFGGPPPPSNSIFSSHRENCCPECTEIIRSTIQETRLTQNSASLSKIVDVIKSCKNGCYKKYLDLLYEQQSIPDKTNIFKRVQVNIQKAKNLLSDYIMQMQ